MLVVRGVVNQRYVFKYRFSAHNELCSAPGNAAVGGSGYPLPLPRVVVSVYVNLVLL